MNGLALDRFIKNATYEITENGIKFKIFGITYTATEQQLDEGIHFLMRLLEKMQRVRKEKQHLTEGSQRGLPNTF